VIGKPENKSEIFKKAGVISKPENKSEIEISKSEIITFTA
jgi:hypothetical protein